MVVPRKRLTMFENYICGTTGLVCCGCSFYCEHRKVSIKTKINYIRAAAIAFAIASLP